MGHKIAFNVLNFARFKLGAMCIGGARVGIAESARYAGERSSSDSRSRPLGAIKYKIAEMVVRTYAIESLIYRTAGMIDARIAAAPHEGVDQSVVFATFEEYAIEASIAKVAGSEMLNFVFDENIQVHGGNGFVRDYPAERHYRDSRVNRIFEGTNEINRLLIPSMLARRAAKGELPVTAAARALQDELLGPPTVPSPTDDSALAEEGRAIEAFKKAALMVLGLAMQTYREEARRRAGSVDPPGRHPDGRVRGRQRGTAGRGGGPVAGSARGAAHRRSARVRQRRRDAHRRIRAAGACRHGRRRHATDYACGAAAAVQDDTREYGRGAAPPCRGNRLVGWIRFLGQVGLVGKVGQVRPIGKLAQVGRMRACATCPWRLPFTPYQAYLPYPAYPPSPFCF